MQFSNTVIWITGASSGIGKALAFEMSRLGAKLILSGRNQEALALVQKACQFPDHVMLLPFDLEQYEKAEEITQQALAKFGRIDILVNNGGISQRSYAAHTTVEVDKRIMEINYLGTIALTKAVLPHFIDQKKGHFVVTTSIVGKIGTPLRSSYSASKHALHGFFDSLRAEHHKDQIKVTIVCPGFVQTNISMNALTGDGSPQQKMDVATAGGIPPSRFARKMAQAIYKQKEEVYIAGAKEKLGVYTKRFFPKILSKMIRKLKVT